MKYALPRPDGDHRFRRNRKRRPSAPSRRSIGVPSCVPLVKYTPRSRICLSKRVDPKTSVTKSASASRSAAICCGNPNIFVRRANVALVVRAARRRSFRRAISASNSSGNALGGLTLDRLVVRERHAPDLRATLLIADRRSTR